MQTTSWRMKEYQSLSLSYVLYRSMYPNLGNIKRNVLYFQTFLDKNSRGFSCAFQISVRCLYLNKYNREFCLQNVNNKYKRCIIRHEWKGKYIIFVSSWSLPIWITWFRMWHYFFKHDMVYDALFLRFH